MVVAVVALVGGGVVSRLYTRISIIDREELLHGYGVN